MTAALKGSKEIGFTIVSMTLSLAAVFIPVLFMGGIVGRLLHEFAVTMGVAILISGLRLADADADAGRAFPAPAARRSTTAGSTWRSSACSTRRAMRTAGRCARHDGPSRAPRWSRRLLLVVATVYCFRIIPMGFIPSQDTGQINGQTEMAQGLGYEAMVAHQLEVMKIVQADPNVKSVTSSIGLVRAVAGRRPTAAGCRSS